MNDQVLSIEQMQKLIELNIDTSKASMCWLYGYKGATSLLFKTDITKSYEFPKYIGHEKVIPTFTLQNMLEILPKYLNVKDNTYFLTLMYDASKGVVISYCTEHIMNILHSEGSNNQLNAPFNMLIWCKQNNYI